jgi:hypothetical protein
MDSGFMYLISSLEQPADIVQEKGLFKPKEVANDTMLDRCAGEWIHSCTFRR